jgi:hypothetical protein
VVIFTLNEMTTENLNIKIFFCMQKKVWKSSK